MSALTPVEEALGRILTGAQAIADIETRPLSDAIGCVLACDLVSPIDVPGADNSAMDG